MKNKSQLKETLELNQELLRYFNKLKNYTPLKLEEIISKVEDTPILEDIVARSLIAAWKEGISLDKMIDRICPNEVTVNLSNSSISGMGLAADCLKTAYSMKIRDVSTHLLSSY